MKNEKLIIDMLELITEEPYLQENTKQELLNTMMIRIHDLYENQDKTLEFIKKKNLEVEYKEYMERVPL